MKATILRDRVWVGRLEVEMGCRGEMRLLGRVSRHAEGSFWICRERRRESSIHAVAITTHVEILTPTPLVAAGLGYKPTEFRT